MSDEKQPEAKTANKTKGRAPRKPLPTWKKLVLALSVVAFVVGLGLTAFASSSGGDVSPNGSAAGGSSGLQPNSFSGAGGTIGSDGTGTTGSDADTSNPWAPFFMKGGLSFFLAFCIGYAARTFLKMTLLVVGVVALAVIGLDQFGAVDIKWDVLQSGWDSVSGYVAAQVSSFKTFLSGSLPSAGMAALGLITGFKQ